MRQTQELWTWLIARGSAATAFAVVTLSAACSTACAAPLRFSLSFTTSQPARASGLVTSITYATGSNGKPKPVGAETVQLPAGTQIDESVVPVCLATDAELYAQGTSACSSDSRLGAGTGAVDTGLGPPIDPLRGEVSVFHGPHELVFTGSPPGTTQVATISRLQIRGSALVNPSVPVTPGWPPPHGETVGQQIETRLLRRRSGTRAFISTPSSCRSGRWIARLLITYRDGSTETASSSIPCHAAPPRRIDRQRSLTRRSRAGGR